MLDILINYLSIYLSIYLSGLGIIVVLGHGEVGLSADRSKSSTAATTDCKASSYSLAKISLHFTIQIVLTVCVTGGGNICWRYCNRSKVFSGTRTIHLGKDRAQHTMIGRWEINLNFK